MEDIYLNWAATSYKKPKEMLDQVCEYLQKNTTGNTSRGIGQYEELTIPLESRIKLAHFFNITDPSHVIFTPNITTSLNMILHGLLDKGDHILTSSIEHNAVVRPLHHLKLEKKIEVSTIPCDLTGQLKIASIESLIKPNTKAIVITHGSNVLGNLQPVSAIFKLAKKHGLITILDTAQTAGVIPIDMKAMNIDILAFTGHKSLLSLPGSGGFVLQNGLEEYIDPWLTGGTGSASASLVQPDFLPDKYEPGTPNLPAILSLGAAVEFIENTGLEKIRLHEQQLTEAFLEGIAELPVTVLGPPIEEYRLPVVSLISSKIDSGVLAQRLYDEHQIVTRCGLHCAPLAHKLAGSFPNGAVRFSFGYYTTEIEIEAAIQGLKMILD